MNAGVFQQGGCRNSAVMAKLHSTDQVQLDSGDGVRSGETVKKLYREIRALRTCEGASDVQKVIIARQFMAAHSGG